MHSRNRCNAAWRTSALVKASMDETNDCQEISNMPIANGATGSMAMSNERNAGYHISRQKKTREK
eukprot:scaffold241814_cov30-Tisochrysis_lutea.AAC.1